MSAVIHRRAKLNTLSHSTCMLPGEVKIPRARRLCCEPYGEIRVLDKLCSGVSYSSLGREFDAKGSTIYIK